MSYKTRKIKKEIEENTKVMNKQLVLPQNKTKKLKNRSDVIILPIKNTYRAGYVKFVSTCFKLKKVLCFNKKSNCISPKTSLLTFVNLLAY